MQIGPFDLKDLLIGGMIILVTAVAMFLLKDILSFGIVLPMWMLIIALMATIVILFMLVLCIMRYMRYGKEGFLFQQARRKGLAVYLDVELGSQVGDFVLAEKDSPKDVVLKDEESGVKVDPGMLSSDASPIRCNNGLDIFIYSYYNYMPQTIKNHAAFAAIKTYFEKECSELNFLSVKEFVELISDPEHFLERNALIKLNKYFKISEKRNAQGEIEYVKDQNNNPIIGPDGQPKPIFTYVRRFEITDDETGTTKLVEQDIDLPGMLTLLSKARLDIARLPIMGGLIAGTEAFKYNSVAYSSQHLGHVLMLYYTKMMDELKSKVDILMYGIVALMILVGGGVAVYLISMALKGGS